MPTSRASCWESGIARAWTARGPRSRRASRSWISRSPSPCRTSLSTRFVGRGTMVVRSFSPDEDRTLVTSPRRFLSAVLMGAAAVLLSCGEPAPTAPAVVVPPLEASIDYSSNGLLHCRPLAYDSVTKTIGPKGGSIRVSKHVLVIPDLALSQPVTITMVAPSDTLNRIQVQPEGPLSRRPPVPQQVARRRTHSNLLNHALCFQYALSQMQLP